MVFDNLSLTAVYFDFSLVSQRHFCSYNLDDFVVAGHPLRRSTLRDSLPSIDSFAHYITVEYDGESSPYPF